MNLQPMMSTGKDDWETPDGLFDLYMSRYNFILDAAAHTDNAKLDRWFGPGGEVEDALVEDWPLEEGNIWLNPPYSRGLQARFVEKAASVAIDWRMYVESPEGEDLPYHHVVCLLPARTDTRLFHDIIKPRARSIEFLRGRVKFKGASQGAPFPSMVVIF